MPQMRSGLRDSLRRAIKTIPGQGSGLSYIYFLIVAGNEDGVKADRMVTRFVAKALDVPNVSPELAEDLVRKASALRSYRGTGEGRAINQGRYCTRQRSYWREIAISVIEVSNSQLVKSSVVVNHRIKSRD